MSIGFALCNVISCLLALSFLITGLLYLAKAREPNLNMQYPDNMAIGASLTVIASLILLYNLVSLVIIYVVDPPDALRRLFALCFSVK